MEDDKSQDLSLAEETEAEESDLGDFLADDKYGFYKTSKKITRKSNYYEISFLTLYYLR